MDEKKLGELPGGLEHGAGLAVLVADDETGYHIEVPNYRESLAIYHDKPSGDCDTLSTPVGGYYNFRTARIVPPSGWNAIWGAGDQCVSLSNVRALDADASYEITPVWSASRGFVIGGGGVLLPNAPMARISVTSPEHWPAWTPSRFRTAMTARPSAMPLGRWPVLQHSA